MKKSGIPKSGELKTGKQVQAHFQARGLSFAEWARANGFSVSLVYSTVYERAKGLRGESHRIAVALGMKRAPVESSPTRKAQSNQAGARV